MHRPLWSRVLYVTLTLWMSLFMSESEWVVRCPSHSGSHAVVGGSPGESQPAAEARAGATAHHDHATPQHTSAPADGEGANHSCSCPGPGCCPSAVAALPQRELPLARIVAIHAATAVSTVELFAEPSEYLHPPATAPPTVGLAPPA